MAEDLVVIGQITRPHGVRGEVRVNLFTDSPDSLKQFKKLFVRRQGQPDRVVRIEVMKPHKASVILKLEGTGNRNDAEDLVGAEILVRRAELPVLDDGEFYWVDLIGLEVYEADNGAFLGCIENMMATPADDMMIVKKDDREAILPFREEIVLEVDLDAGRVVVRPPEGLLEL